MKTIDFEVYNVTKGKNGQNYWNKLGGAFKFQTQDGREGFNIPNMKLVVIQPKEELTEIQPEVDNEILSEV